ATRMGPAAAALQRCAGVDRYGTAVARHLSCRLELRNAGAGRHYRRTRARDAQWRRGTRSCIRHRRLRLETAATAMAMAGPDAADRALQPHHRLVPARVLAASLRPGAEEYSAARGNSAAA